MKLQQVWAVPTGYGPWQLMAAFRDGPRYREQRWRMPMSAEDALAHLTFANSRICRERAA